jgi:PAS domain S-box-containing protein
MTIRILLADEHQVVRQGLRNLLANEPDFNVVAEADTGEAVLRLVAETSPEVVVLDLAMADSKGVEVVHRLVQTAPNIKVIGLSTYGDRRLGVEVLKTRGFGYVLKDHASEDLVAAIRAAQEQKTYISQALSDIILHDYIELLRFSETRFRSIFEDATIGIALMDKQGRIVESNPALQEFLGYNQDELGRRKLYELVESEEGIDWGDLFQNLVAGNRKPYQLEQRYMRRDGRLEWGRLVISPLRGAGEGQFAIGMLEDIGPRKEAETRIRDYQEKLRSVALELSRTEEQERRRLATDLHDNVGQILALVLIKLGALRESASSGQAGTVNEIRQLIAQTIRYTRSLSFELSPPILYELGFEAAVEWLGEQIQEKTGIHLKVSADRSPKPLNDEIRVLLFQLVRELLDNMVRRAKPNNISVVISRNGSSMRVTIENDGVEVDLGAESPLPSPNGLGLFSIRERLQHLGGSLEVESGLGHGTRMSLAAPLKY